MIQDPILSKLSEILQYYSLIKTPEELTVKNQKEVIKKFQSTFSLPANGELTPDTLWTLQERFVLDSPALKIVEIPVDTYSKQKGLGSVTFREDAGLRFTSLQEEVKSLGGLITVSAGIRDIKMVAGVGQSATSMHYPGLAFDLNIKAGFFEPETDLYIITKFPTPDKKNPLRFRWNVFCRADHGEEMELDAYYWENEKSGKDLKKIVRGKFINFTEIAKKHGFHPIRPQSCFTRSENRFYICCEWWHFQANDLLIPKFSQLGIELLKLDGFSPDFLEKNNSGVWNSRKFIYFVNWW